MEARSGNSNAQRPVADRRGGPEECGDAVSISESEPPDAVVSPPHPAAGAGAAVVLAARVCAAPLALVSLLPADCDTDRLTLGPGLARVWFAGPAGSALHRLVAGTDRLLVIPDLIDDARVATDPLVRSAPAVRFLAAAPVVGSDGTVLGGLCVLDCVPRSLSPQQQVDLTVVAGQLAEALVLQRRVRRLAGQLAALESSHQALQDRQRLLDGVLAHADVLVYAKDLDERFVYANAALERAVGFPGGLVGRPNHEVFPADWAEEYRRNDAQIAQVGSGEVFDEEIVDASGVVRQLRSTTYPLRDEHGRVYAIAGVSTDVTELAAARTAVSEAEQRWRSLVEHSAVGVGLIGIDGRIVYLNPTGLDLCGAQPGEHLEGRLVAEFVPDDSRGAASELFRALLAGESPLHARRWRLRRLDGREVTVELNAEPVVHLGRRAVQVQLRDVSARVAAEDALRASERRFRAVFENSPVAIALSDEHGRWRDVNAAFCRLYGREPSEMIGATAADFAHPDDRVLIDGSQEGQLASPDGVHRFEARLLRRDGQVRRSWISLNAMPGPEGQPWTLAVVEDITARRAAEDALRDSQAELTAIAEVARCVQSGADPRPVVLRSVRTLSGATTVSMIEALDAETLIVTGCEGADFVGRVVPPGRPTVSGEVWRTGRPVFLADVADSPVPVAAPEGTVSALWQPVIVGGLVHALLLATWSHRIPGPSDSAARAVRILADEAATSLDAARLRGELERSAMTDPLTGSLNRRAWDLALSGHAAAATTVGAPLTLAIVDLDRFKAFNDTHGHSEGDALLRDFAAAARACLRRNDIFARWGGEEFSVALSDVDGGVARQVLDRILRCVPRGQTCSIGFTDWNPAEPLTSGLARADAALYDAKNGGRNRLAFRPSPQTEGSVSRSV